MSRFLALSFITLSLLFYVTGCGPSGLDAIVWPEPCAQSCSVVTITLNPVVGGMMTRTTATKMTDSQGTFYEVKVDTCQSGCGSSNPSEARWVEVSAKTGGPDIFN